MIRNIQNQSHEFRVRIYRTLIFVFLAGFFISGCKYQPEPVAEVKNNSELKSEGEIGPSAKNVGLFVDFGKEKEQLRIDVIWKKDLTAISIIDAAEPKVNCKYRGSGETCFLTSIEGVKNDLPAKKYWIYYVNGKKGTVGAGAYQLEPGDKVLWRFGSDAIE